MAFRRRGTQMLVLLAAGVLVAAKVPRSPADNLPLAADRPECPHDSVYKMSLDHGLVTALPAGAVTLSGYKAAIPEFHDCQRLLTSRRARGPVPTRNVLSYGPLAAVYASARLDSLINDLKYPKVEWGRQGGYAPGILRAGTYAVAVATVLSYDGVYAPLGMKRGFNCLYLRMGSAGTHQSWLVPNADNPRCLPAKLVADLNSATSTNTATSLRVIPYSVAGLAFDDYPPSARWDWDRKNHWQYIGLKCGSAWCEIGPPTFEPSMRYTAPSGYTTTTERRVFEVKGWYDEQYLSVYDAVSKRIRPSSTFGTVFPDPTLDSYRIAGDANIPAAIIVISGDTDEYYKNKWDFAPMRDGQANRLALKKTGSAPTTWHGIVHPPGASPTAARKVYYRDHSADISAGGGFTIPGNARWRWVATDERIWVGCDVGCCEAAEIH